MLPGQNLGVARAVRAEEVVTMFQVGDRVIVVGEPAPSFPGVWQVDEVDPIIGDAPWVGCVTLVPEGCVGLAAEGVGQESFTFDLSEVAPAP